MLNPEQAASSHRLSDAHFNPQAGSRQHVDKRIEAEKVDLPSHKIRYARLRDAKQADGLTVLITAIVNALRAPYGFPTAFTTAAPTSVSSCPSTVS